MKIKYAAKVSHVRETSLVGVAELAPWQSQLAARGLTALERDGRAEIMLSAIKARFKGVPFRECTISVRAREIDTRAEGWFLAQGFSSIRFFAWVERTMFSTPYELGAIESSVAPPALVEVKADGGLLRAIMHPSAVGREPSRSGQESSRGPLFLPPRPGKPATDRKLFYAVLEGHTRAYPFVPTLDEISITPSPKWPIFATLAGTNFLGVEWLLRDDAFHAKSQTYSGPAQQVDW